MSKTLPAALNPVSKGLYPHRPRLLFVLKRRTDVSREAFEDALRAWRQQWAFGVEFEGVIARAGAASVEDQEFLSGAFRAGGTEITPLDGYVSLDLESYDPTAADLDRLIGLAEGCLDTLTGVIDSAESIGFAGIVNLVIPGFAPLSMVLILDRLEGLTVEQYNEWWVRHGDDHRRTNPAQVGYHQLHIAPELNAAAAKAARVSTTDRCIIDMMYLGRTRNAFSDQVDHASEEARAMSVDINAHVSMANVSGGLMREL
jgi:hypothetical protein